MYNMYAQTVYVHVTTTQFACGFFYKFGENFEITLAFYDF